MFLVYFLIAVLVLKAIEYLINAALARKHPAASSRNGPIVSHTGPIIDRTLGRTIGAWIVALPVDFFGGRFMFGMTRYPFFGAQIPMYVILTAIIVAATLTALRWSRRLYRFGRSFVCLEDGSASVGGRLKGTLTIPHTLPPDTTVLLELICTRTSSHTMTGVDRSFRSRNEYDQQDKIEARTSRDPISTIPFKFEIPDSVTPTISMRQIGDLHVRYAWSLTAASTTPGVDYWAKFAIPVAASPRDQCLAAAASGRMARPVHNPWSSQRCGSRTRFGYKLCHRVVLICFRTTWRSRRKAQRTSPWHRAPGRLPVHPT